MLRTLLFAGFLFTASAIFSQLNMSLAGYMDYQSLHNANLSDCWGYVDETGIEYALVGTTKGLSILNISNPAAPVEVAWIPGIESRWRDIQVWEDHAYVTNEDGGGLLIVDLSPLPFSDVLPVTSYHGPDSNLELYWTTAHSIFIDSEGYAYVCGADRLSGGIIILDVHTDPMHPMEVGRFEHWYCHDAFVQGDILYGAHIYQGILSVIDITNRSNPVLVNTQMTPDSFTHSVSVTSNNEYAVTADETAGSWLTLYNVSDPENLIETDRIRSSSSNNGIPHNPFILNDELIVSSYYTHGITVHDMSRPHNLVEIANYDTNPLETGTFNGSWGVYPFFPSGLFIVSDIEEGLFILQPEIISPCYFEGVVRDATDLNVLEGVSVTMENDLQTDLSDQMGEFGIGTVIPGMRSVSFNKAAYYPKTLNIPFTATQVIIDTIDLIPMPSVPLQIRVVDLVSGIPLIGADIRLEVPEMMQEAQTNGFGEHDFLIWYSGTTTITAGKWGYKTICETYTIDSATGVITIGLKKGIYDDFSFDFGWTVVTENATSGIWERGKPNGTAGMAAPDDDAEYDCGDYAFVTGNRAVVSADADDVDYGTVSLYSPQFDLTQETDPYIHYQRWFYSVGSSTSSQDDLDIFLTNGTDYVYVDLAQGNGQHYSQWISMSLHVSDYMTPSSSMQLIIVTSDEGPFHTITEAGLDFFFVANEDHVEIAETGGLQQIKVSPNPVTTTLTIAGLSGNCSYCITDLTGKVAVKGIVSEPDQRIDCSGLSEGMYLLHIQDRTFRIVKS